MIAAAAPPSGPATAVSSEIDPSYPPSGVISAGFHASGRRLVVVVTGSEVVDSAVTVVVVAGRVVLTATLVGVSGPAVPPPDAVRLGDTRRKTPNRAAARSGITSVRPMHSFRISRPPT